MTAMEPLPSSLPLSPSSCFPPYFKFKFWKPLKIFSLGVAQAPGKAIFFPEILAQNKSALCRFASLAFSFILFQISSDVWLQHLFNQRTGKRKQSVYIYLLRGPLHSNSFFYFKIVATHKESDNVKFHKMTAYTIIKCSEVYMCFHNS